MKKILIAFFAALMLITAFASSGGYSTAFAEKSSSVAQPHLTQQQIETAITLIKPHIHFDAQGQASLDTDNQASLGLDTQTSIFFKQGLKEYNASLSKILATKPALSLDKTKNFSHDSCSGSQGASVRNNTLTLYLNECTTVQIEAALGIAGALLGIASIIVGLIPLGQPFAVALGIAAGIAGVGAGSLLFLDALGGFNGIYVNARVTSSGAEVFGIGHQ